MQEGELVGLGVEVVLGGGGEVYLFGLVFRLRGCGFWFYLLGGVVGVFGLGF